MALTFNGTSGISGVDGSASAASIRGTDSNTGFSFASDTVNVNTAGITRATITDNETKITGLNGNITTNQYGHLFLQNTNNSSSNFWGISPRDNGDLDIGYGSKSSSLIAGDVATFKSTGNLLLGATSASSGETRLTVKNDTAAKVSYFHHDHNSQRSCIDCQNDYATGGQSAIMIEFRQANGGSVGGIFASTSNVSYNTASDYRLKENQVAISDGITRLKTLKPYRFNFKGESATVDGFFAHEVTAVPEAISGTKDEVTTTYYEEGDTIPEGKALGDVKSTTTPVYQGIDQSKLVPLLTAALQEAVGKIETLETKVAALEAG